MGNKCIVIIEGVSYDLTDFQHSHPGGKFILQKFNGKDATKAFYQNGHSNFARGLMERYAIGPSGTPVIKEEDYAQHRKKLEATIANLPPHFGPFERYAYTIPYLYLRTIQILGLIGCGFSVVQLSFWQNLSLSVLAYFTSQTFFISGHLTIHFSFLFGRYQLNPGQHIAYLHHYIHPHMMPHYSYYHMIGWLLPEVLISLFLLPCVLSTVMNSESIVTGLSLLSYTFTWWFFEEPGHDWYHVPSYLREQFFDRGFNWPFGIHEYDILNVCEKLRILSKPKHTRHHSATNDNQEDTEDFDDFGLPIITQIMEGILWPIIVYMHKKGGTGAATNTYWFLVFSVIFITSMTWYLCMYAFHNWGGDYHILLGGMVYILLIFIQTTYIEKDFPIIKEPTIRTKLVKKEKLSSDTFMLEYKTYTPLNLPCFGHLNMLLNNPYEKDYYHNGVANRDLLKVFARPYTPFNITSEGFNLLVKTYNKCEEYPHGGKMSHLIAKQEVGEIIKFQVINSSYLPLISFGDIENKNIVIICAGTGITPFLSMFEYAMNHVDMNITVVWYNRDKEHSHSLDGYINNLQDMSEGITPRFVLKHIISTPAQSEHFYKGLDKTYFICGPPGFTCSVRNLLEKIGVTPIVV